MSWMGRRLAEFEPLWPAERKLAREMTAGQMVVIGTVVPPEDAGREPRIRASFLRYLALGGCEDCRPPEYGIRLRGAYVEGDGPDPAAAGYQPASWEGNTTRGLDFEGCALKGNLLLHFCRIPDLVGFYGAQAGTVSLSGSELGGGLSGDAMEARGWFFMCEAKVAGEVRLAGASLGGGFDASGASFTGAPDAEGQPGVAVNLTLLSTGASVYLGKVTVAGELRLAGARLGADIDLSEASFRAALDAEGQPGLAIGADGLQARGWMFLRKSTVKGQVLLTGMKLGGGLDGSDSSFEAAKDASGAAGSAILADGLATGGTSFLSGADANGEVRMIGARLDSDLVCERARFRTDLNLDRAQVKGTLFLREGTEVAGVLDLTAAEVGTLNDTVASWPGEGRLKLDRFRYGAFTGGPVDAKRRLDWLSRQRPAGNAADFWPQPYQQLAQVLRETGHEEEARTVLVEKERLAREAELTDKTGRAARLGHRIFSALLAMVDFGYRPQRALWPVLVLILIGWFVVDRAAQAGVLAPARAHVAGTPEVALVPLAYSFEAFVPILRLGQAEAFRPDMATPAGRWLQIYLWVHGLAGWLIGGAAAAGVLRLFRRD